MKKALKITLLIIAFAALLPFAWSIIPQYSTGATEYRYSRELHIVEQAIENSGCAKIKGTTSLDDSIPEEICFQLTYESGQRLLLFFDVRGKEVKQMINEPAGLTVAFETDAGSGMLDQAYSIETLAALLVEKNVEVKNLKDILCHMDVLKSVLKANQTNQNIPRIPLGNVKDYWHILFIER
jgi:hypothetical protein